MDSFLGRQSFETEDLVSLERTLHTSDSRASLPQPRAITNHDHRERSQQYDVIEYTSNSSLAALEATSESKELHPLSLQFSGPVGQDNASDMLNLHGAHEELADLGFTSISNEEDMVLELASSTTLRRGEQSVLVEPRNEPHAPERSSLDGQTGSTMQRGIVSNSEIISHLMTPQTPAFEAGGLKRVRDISGDLAYERKRNKVPTYCYPPLPSGKDNIRLLRLMPARDKTVAVSCELFDYSLTSGWGTHLYEALSYVWGDPTDTVPVLIGEEPLNVTSNLHSALLHLRNHTMERILWVDAICIDQGNRQEKENQIQYMAEIYGQAKCVVVWLGEDADDGQQALEDIRAAAEDDSPIISNDALISKPLSNEPPYDIDSILQNDSKDFYKVKRVTSLFYRPWFQRMWVLQEVASARQILIVCGETELDGYVFCTGLRGLQFPDGMYSGLQGIVRSMTYLIRGASFRSRSGVRTTSRVSLGTLVDMYHTRNATIPHDKVYALLGMSSDDHSIHGISPNYALPWKNLKQQLINFILGKAAAVDILDDKDVAMIKSRGCVVGRVTSVSASERYDRQQVQIAFSSTSASSECRKRWGEKWTLQASAKSIETDDIVCLLEGVTVPTIIRTSEYGYEIILIAAIPVQSVTLVGPIESGWFSSTLKLYERTFRLMWIWNLDKSCLEEDVPLMKSFRDTHKLPTTLYDKALILRDLEHYKDARECLEVMLANFDLKDTSEDGRMYHLMDEQLRALMHAQAGERSDAERILLQVIDKQQELYGRDHAVTLISKAYLVSIYLEGQIGHKIRRTSRLKELARRVRETGTTTSEQLFAVIEWTDSKSLALLLSLRKKEIPTSQKLLKAVFKNQMGNPTSMLEVLLDQRGTEIQIEQKMVIDAAEHRFGKDMMSLLLDRRGEEVHLTEEVVKAAATNFEGSKILKLLLDRRGEEVHITEEVVKAAAGAYHGRETMELLLDRRGEEVHITEDVIKVIIRGYRGLEVLKLFHKQMLKDITVTEELLKIALRNPDARGVIAQLHNAGCPITPISIEVLELVATFGGLNLLRLLCSSAGIDVVPQRLEHIAKLWRATALGATETVVRLVELDTPLGQTDIRGQTLLHIAAGRDHIEIIRILLEKDTIDVNARDDINRTPLFYAAWRSSIEVVRLLLDHGARQEDVDSSGHSPLSTANDLKRTEIADLLRKYNTGGSETWARKPL